MFVRLRRWLASPTLARATERALDEVTPTGRGTLYLELHGMPEQPHAPEHRTRDVTIARLRELRPGLEAEGVRHAFLFGSVARGDDVPESDVDIIVDLDPERHIGLIAFAGIQEFLEIQLGRNVDLGSLRSLMPGRHDEILRELVEAF